MDGKNFEDNWNSDRLEGGRFRRSYGGEMTLLRDVKAGDILALDQDDGDTWVVVTRTGTLFGGEDMILIADLSDPDRSKIISVFDERIAPFFGDGDVLGLGGWCIMGKIPRLLHSFRETMVNVIPYAAQFTSRVHIWGVMYAPALGNLLWLCDRHGLSLSTDSTGPALRPIRGVWGYMGWSKPYARPPVEIRGLERARHVRATRDWLLSFRDLPYYCDPCPVRKLFLKEQR